MSKRKPKLYIQDILSSIQKIEEYVKDVSFSEFKNDTKTIDSVVRNLEIIGEAAANIPQETTKKYPNIEWGKMVSMRNKVVHEYFGIDNEILWKTIEEDLPKLKEQTSTLLGELED